MLVVIDWKEASFLPPQTDIVITLRNVEYRYGLIKNSQFLERYPVRKDRVIALYKVEALQPPPPESPELIEAVEDDQEQEVVQEVKEEVIKNVVPIRTNILNRQTINLEAKTLVEALRKETIENVKDGNVQNSDLAQDDDVKESLDRSYKSQSSIESDDIAPYENKKNYIYLILFWLSESPSL